MTYKRMNELRGLDAAIECKQGEIARLKAKAMSTVSKLTGEPRASGISDKVGDGASAIADAERELRELKGLRRTRDKFVSSIADIDVRTAVKLYFCGHRRTSWESVARRMGYSESGIRNKVNRYLDRKQKPKKTKGPRT